MAASIWPPTLWKLSFWQQWFRIAHTNNQVATLNPRQIYILPTRWGLLFAVMVIALLVGSINYSLSLGYYVTFLLASLGNMAMLHTWRNLLHLQVRIVQAKPVFASETATVAIQVSDTHHRARYAVAGHFIDAPESLRSTTITYRLDIASSSRTALKPCEAACSASSISAGRCAADRNMLCWG